MAKRKRVEIEDVADPALLELAFWRAAGGKRGRPEVRAFSSRLGDNLAAIRAGLLAGTFPFGTARTFLVRDPKQRLIHAPAFPERVVHHALIEKIGPALEGLLTRDTFACRSGKGPLAAVRRAQQHLSRFRCFTQADVRSYFASIRHARLEAILRRRLKGSVLDLISAILRGHGGNRVLRGGSWNENARNVRAAYRNWNEPGVRNDNLGFRFSLARKRAGGPAFDPTLVRHARSGGECSFGRRSAGRLGSSPPNAPRRSRIFP